MKSAYPPEDIIFDRTSRHRHRYRRHNNFTPSTLSRPVLHPRRAALRTGPPAACSNVSFSFRGNNRVPRGDSTRCSACMRSAKRPDDWESSRWPGWKSTDEIPKEIARYREDGCSTATPGLVLTHCVAGDEYKGDGSVKEAKAKSGAAGRQQRAWSHSLSRASPPFIVGTIPKKARQQCARPIEGSKAR